MGHPQQAMTMNIYNSTTEGVENDTIQVKIIKAIDMQLCWIKYRILQGHYNMFWKPGANNLAEYFARHRLLCHHRRMRPVYLHYTGNANNASARVCYYIHNTSLNKYQSKTQIRNKAHLQISKIE